MQRVMVPQGPVDDVVELGQSVGVQTIWAVDDGTFANCAGGCLTH